jgi:hypothetical protein
VICCVQGAINSLAVGVNFSTQQITSYALNASAGGVTWNVDGNGAIAQFTGVTGIALTAAGKLPAAITGTAHGAFVGAAAEGMITSFGLSAAGKSLSGAAYLER